MNTELNNCCFDEIWQRINDSSKIVLLSHVRPDGDAIGSQIALGSILESMDKKVVLVNEDGCPENLNFLSGSKKNTKTSYR